MTAATRTQNRTRKKEGRRPKGSGAAYFIAERNIWACAVEVQRGSNGRRRRRIVYGKTRLDAERKIADLKARQGGTLQPVNHVRIGDYVVQWLDGVATRVRPKTAASYRWAWTHAEAIIGGTRVDRFDRGSVLEMFSELSRSGASANTIRHVSRVLQTALQDAIADGIYAGVNPFTLVQKQKPKHKV